MTKILLVCGKDGLFKSVSAQGHASFSTKGFDIVCAAESFLLRMAFQVLEKTEGLVVVADSSSRGKFSFQVEDINCKNEPCGCVEQKLRFTADFIREGLSSLQTEYPENIQFEELSEQ